MIQDIKPYVFNNQYTPRPAEDDSVIALAKGGTTAVKKHPDGTIEMPLCKDFLPDAADREKLTYLFEISGQAFYKPSDAQRDELLPVLEAAGFEMLDARTLTLVLPRLRPVHLTYGAAIAQQFTRFYDSNRFCPRCGQPLVPDSKERMLRCGSCSNMIFPRINPCVMVAVRNGNKLLCTKYLNHQAAHYAMIAGFIETGETVEECCQREVMEEVGVKIKNLQFYKSQPWPMSDSLMIGYYCDLDGSDEIRLQRSELSVGVWVDREELPDAEDCATLAHDMITTFKRGLDPHYIQE